MSTSEQIIQEEIDAKIAAMNQAEYDYDRASTPEQEKAADSRFSAWLGIGS